MNQQQLKQSIKQEAAQCVKCGLCLPHCPTYQVTQNECESPRGRIALLDGLAKDQLPLTKKVEAYLDHCLTCRACEMVCPAKVPYGQLIDQGKELLAQKNPQRQLPRSITFTVLQPKFAKFTTKLLYYYQQLGLQFLLRKVGILKILGLERLDALLPALKKPQKWQSYYPAQGAEQGRVALFLGCVNNFVDQATLAATIKVITACGYAVFVPIKQRCCGAIHLHAGFAEKAQQLAKENQKAFLLNNVDAIISVASGCCVVLKEYADENFRRKIIDINQFLHQINWPSTIILNTLKERVVLHTPCTMRNVLQQSEATLQVLKKIPDIDLHTFSSKVQCCGAAGLNMLQHPTMANRLIDDILREIQQLKPNILVTANIGCALHIAAASAKKGYKIRVIHPVTLLAEQMIY